MNTIRGELLEERYEGNTYYIHQDCRIRGGCPRTILLPSYDEYLIGYKSRRLQRSSESGATLRPGGYA